MVLPRLDCRRIVGWLLNWLKMSVTMVSRMRNDFVFCCVMRDRRARKRFLNNLRLFLAKRSSNGEFGEKSESTFPNDYKIRRLELAQCTFEYLIGALR
jgi:hypothetical protein